MNTDQKPKKEVRDNSQPAVDTDEILSWLATSAAENIPISVKFALEGYLDLKEGFEGSRRKLGVILKRLKISMGIIPSSEKRKSSGRPLGNSLRDKHAPRPKDPLAALELRKEEHDQLASWHRKMTKKHVSHSNKLSKRIEERIKVEDIILTPEEDAAAQEEAREHLERARSGGGADPVFANVSESFMNKGVSKVIDTFTEVSVDREGLAEEVKIDKSFTDERVRYNFDFRVSKVHIDVEKLVVIGKDGERSIITADTRAIGPAKMRVTWDFLANMAILVSQYAVPFNRFASLTSTNEKIFTAGEISRHFHYIARRFLPVYNYLGINLSFSSFLAGDDTSVRVTEVKKAFDKMLPDNELPWRAYASVEEAQNSWENCQKEGIEASLGILTAKDWGFVSNYRNGKGKISRLQTTLLWGRTEDDNPASTVVFYRTHFGGLGNLLDAVLQNRPVKKNKLVIQSDLSTVNLVSDEVLRQKLEITYAGCASHARRPFAIFEDLDPDLCAHILHMFQGLYINEKSLDLYGRNKENIRAVREQDSLPMWEAIKELASQIAAKWPRASDLGEGARYIMKNFEKLTYYIKDSRVGLSNDFSERLLRMEKLIEANALFRSSLDGRFALDIVRTVLQTAIASQVNLKSYIKWLLMSNEAAILERPKDFTPLAYSRLPEDQKKDPSPVPQEVADLIDELEDILDLPSGWATTASRVDRPET